MSRRIRVVALVIGLLALQLPALGATVSIGGPWSHTRNGITCQFSGGHDQFGSWARAWTTDHNGFCELLKVRLKHQTPDNQVVTSPWSQAGGEQHFIHTTYPSTTISSEHQAQHPAGTWSNVQRPHAF
jgi:hypothetical protein